MRSGILRLRYLTISIVLLVCGCTKSAGIELEELPKTTVYSSDDFRISGHAIDKHGKRLQKPPLSFAVSDGKTLEDLGAGIFRCRASGDATVQVSISEEIKKDIEVVCRIVDRVEISPQIQLQVGGPARALNAKVYAGTALLDDAPLEVELSDGSIARYQAGEVIPLSFGRATLKASVGNIHSKADVEVSENVGNEEFGLPDKESRDWRFSSGEF